MSDDDEVTICEAEAESVVPTCEAEWPVVPKVRSVGGKP
jgi:hypothetical protein